MDIIKGEERPSRNVTPVRREPKTTAYCEYAVVLFYLPFLPVMARIKVIAKLTAVRITIVIS